MKKMIAVIALVAVYSATRAQVTLPKTDAASGVSSALKNFVKPPAIGDVGSTTGSIISTLGSKLALSAIQKPKLTSIVSGFLTNKKSIIGLADSNPTSYLSKLKPLQSCLFSKIKTALGAAAFSKFMGLKPSGSDVAGNVLSNLFF